MFLKIEGHMWIEFAVEMVLITLVIYDTEIEERVRKMMSWETNLSKKGASRGTRRNKKWGSGWNIERSRAHETYTGFHKKKKRLSIEVKPGKLNTVFCRYSKKLILNFFKTFNWVTLGGIELMANTRQNYP